LSSNEPGEPAPYNDPYYGYQDPAAYQPAEGYTGYESQPSQGQTYEPQAYDNSAYQEQAVPTQKRRQHAQPETLQRVQSGIPGFDQILNGGLIRDRVYLLTGPAGAGKTIFSSQFVYNGITKFNENGVYVVLEETPQQLRQNLYSSFGWDFGYMEESGNLVILDAISSRLGLGSDERFVVPRPFTLESLLYEMETAIRTVNARRVIIDSLDAMSLELTQADLRSLIQRLTIILKSFGCTTFLVSGQTETHQGRKPVEEYVVDGMIKLQHSLEESVSGETVLEQDAMSGNSLAEDSFAMKVRSRRIEIPKMRGTSHSSHLHPFTISQEGIEIKSEPEVTKRLRRAIFKAKDVA
jgi:KaiC/GvpD/RAD55 family RecA-like ATPase